MKQYLLRLDKSLLKDLQDLPSKQYKQIVQKILSLPMDPKPQDAKALKGVKDGYRVTQGEYRILYYVVETPLGSSLAELFPVSIQSLAIAPNPQFWGLRSF